MIETQEIQQKKPMVGVLPQKRIYFIGDLASYLGVSKSLIGKWCKSGLIQSGQTDMGYNVFTPAQIEKIKSWYEKRSGFVSAPEAAKRLGTTPHYVLKIISDGYLCPEKGPLNRIQMSEAQFKELEIVFKQLSLLEPAMLIPLKKSREELKREKDLNSYKNKAKCRVANCATKVAGNGLLCSEHFAKTPLFTRQQYVALCQACDKPLADIQKYGKLLQQKRELEALILSSLTEQENRIQELAQFKKINEEVDYGKNL